jgi:membrane associated rhomboid family serine protease
MPSWAVLSPGYHYVGVAHGEWYRLLTGAFVHELPTAGALGIFHIVFNMWWLWRLGPLMERQLGRLRFLALYLIAALGSSVCVFLLDPDQLAIGASGAIFGLVGGYYVLSRKLRHDPLGGSGLLMFFVIWMVVSAGIASWQGHLGGLLAGLAVGAAFAYAPRDKGYAFWQGIGAALVLGLLLLAVGWQAMQLTGTV